MTWGDVAFCVVMTLLAVILLAAITGFAWAITHRDDEDDEPEPTPEPRACIPWAWGFELHYEAALSAFVLTILVDETHPALPAVDCRKTVVLLTRDSLTELKRELAPNGGLV
jgi:hypothetical protein